MAIKPPTKAESEHMAAVAELGCIACIVMDIIDSPAECHHTRAKAGAGQRSSHMDVIPLCPPHHRTGGYGVAFHAGKIAFEQKFGTEEELLERTNKLLMEC
jgi:hypothetical protein